jgi:sugar lactone lactonase YvrE
VHIFDRCGQVLNVWEGVRRPADLAIMPDGNMACCEHPTDYYYLDELDYSIPFYVKIFDRTGRVLAKLETGLAHGIAVDSRGDIYLANHHTVNKCERLD